MEWTIGDVVDAISDRTITVCGDRRTTYADIAVRARRFANYLADRGFGANRERAQLLKWECGQGRVALIMNNDRYPELVIGCLKARTVPMNINSHCTPWDIADLLGYVIPRSVVYHRSPGARFAGVLTRIDGDSNAGAESGAADLDDAIAQRDPVGRSTGSPDDVIMYRTGVSSMVGDDHGGAFEIHDKVTRNGGGSWYDA